MERYLKSFITSLRRKKVLVFILLISFLIALISLFIPVMGDYLVVFKPLQHADALVVMAGETSVRLPAAARLYKEGKADKILLTNDGIFSSWSEEKQRNLYEVEWSEDKLLRMGIPGSAIVKLTYSASGSIFDALNTRKFVLANGVRSLIIVTSDYHTRRSLWAFERVFQGRNVNIGVYPADSGMCKISKIRKSALLLLELTKYLYYKSSYSNIQ